ncbi:hypothetical protein Fleli_0037 [Bernardetia litoralis DSM 6794]|uniref:Sulfatase-modifying factor enzyme-like domain-containing protein n=1 Tax=Bernardetia litoralis (strain ATCC 23117 / DSM 6794 / NBRC 15988 / NCIMB 1366 / Fx l1 / Sio-4) TaxID=880071 RepID=I4AF13_BERLS|nr:SUMF1/EgtB/PvdO family nonheme iron enzyme [Bernardetia litoralis]AFM02548.1 hypothetical protein Fleli_0037 [Bernardetia litoralis DSM 6794]
MKNIFFVAFLFLPFLSYSQISLTALSSFEENVQDSSLTIFLKSSNTEHKRDTIYPKEIPKKLFFIFEDIDSTNRRSYAGVTLARGRRAINTFRARTNRLIFPIQYVIWQTDFFVIEVEDTSKDSTQVFLQSIQILPKPILDEIKAKKEEIIQDSLNRIAAIEHHKNHFEKLKEPQENLTEKDKKKIAKIYSKIKLTDGYKTKIGNHKLIDKGEIANIHWVEYLHFLLEDSSTEQYLNALPDTTIWNKFYQNDTVDYHYFRNPVYKDFPVVGITYEQAQKYCIWRGNMDTKTVNEKMRKKYKDYEIILRYTLPTKEEWEYAAKKYDLNKNSKSNVAEMTFKKGIAKGGSFVHTLEECAADRVQVYDSPQAWLGFRCVTEVVVRKKEDVE